MRLLSAALVLALFAATACHAQAPPSTPCSAASFDCCQTQIEHVTIDGVTYLHQVCRNRIVVECTPGCHCAGECDDSSARCTCLDPSESPSVSSSQPPTGTRSPSLSRTPSTTATATATATATVAPSLSPGASVSKTKTRAPTHSHTRAPTSHHPTTSVSATAFPHAGHPTLSASSAPVQPVDEKADTHVAIIVAAVVVAVCCACLALVVLGALAIYKKLRYGRVYGSVPLSDQQASLTRDAEGGGEPSADDDK